MDGIIFSSESIGPQLAELISRYPTLSIITDTDSHITLSGPIHVFRTYNGYTLNNSYSIEIGIPVNSQKLPYITDIGEHIDNAYHHLYTDTRQLCLATDTQIIFRFMDGFSLVAWMEEFVEPYYFSYEYYQRYGEFPFGERSHGTPGVLETYCDIFKTNNLAEAYLILCFICSSPYRGHLNCPCGSNKKIRNCHGAKMLIAYKSKDIMELIQKDFKLIDEYVKEVINDHQKKAK